MVENIEQETISDRISSETELKKASEYFIKKFDLGIEIEIEIENRFKRKAGEYRHDERKIRISRHLLENYPKKVEETVKHELGHAVVMQKYGKNVKPHGREWKSVMQGLGVKEPEACHSLQLAEYSYIVKCTDPKCDVKLGRYRKSRLVKTPELYRCKKCGSVLESFEVNEE